MSQYPHGGPPQQYPAPQQVPNVYPVLPPQPGQPGMNYYPAQNPQYPMQPGFTYSYPGHPGMPGQVPEQAHVMPHAMSYPGMPVPTAPPPAYVNPAQPVITPTPTFSPTIEWVPTTPAHAYTLTEKAVVAGYEGHDGSPLWVIRARYEGDLIPGKLPIKHKVAYVPWGGKENRVENIEVCCASPEKVRWVESRDGVVPPNAVLAGNTSDGEPLYVGRAREQGSLTPGKIHQSHKTMYMSFAGQEIPHKCYEVLCTV